MKRIITKSIIRNQFGLLETTDKLGIRRHRFFATRKEAADFLRRLHSWRLTHRCPMCGSTERERKNVVQMSSYGEDVRPCTFPWHRGIKP